ncbi:MAG TPA: endolytic transglycosylase MltG [Gammaproteobacteria bacterium]|nr:endolytic transglycosylase MltG [Gammaproteobacteria bacterium]
MFVVARLGLIGLIGISALVIVGRIWLDSIKSQPVAVQSLEVSVGSTASEVLKELNPKLTNRSRALVFLLYPQFSYVHHGRYIFSSGTTVLAALAKIHKGDAVVERLTIPEGITARDLFDRLSDHKALVGQVSLVEGVWSHLSTEWSAHEGVFLAETYLWQQKISKDALLKQAHKSLLLVLNETWDDADPIVRSILSSPYELLILASIVEKETALASERPRIAGVFLERLKRQMRLQTDPTVIYGLGDNFDGNLTRKHLSEKTAYNTYTIDGLPPTPIAIVGPEALIAVARPEMTGELYFVADGSGGHAFSRTLEAHNANVRKYQLKR